MWIILAFYSYQRNFGHYITDLLKAKLKKIQYALNILKVYMTFFPRDAWSALGNMSKEEAMIAYVDEMKKVCLLMKGFSRTSVPETEEYEGLLLTSPAEAPNVIPYVSCYISVLCCLACGEKKITKFFQKLQNLCCFQGNVKALADRKFKWKWNTEIMVKGALRKINCTTHCLSS